tara:strand:+ start:1923 stop:2708 length:786 start_codon:yes stop_codon:yes gene_type:complete
MFLIKNLIYLLRIGVIKGAYRKFNFISEYLKVSKIKINKLQFIVNLLKSEIIKKRQKSALEKQKIYYQKKYNFTDIDWFSPNIPIWDTVLKQTFFNKEKIEYLEIGTYEGRSTIHICENFKNFKITVVDPYIEYNEVNSVVKDSNMEKVFERFKKNSFNFSDRISINRTTSNEFFKKNKKKFDLIYIDGSHHYLDVKEDLINSIKFININGIIILDDFIWDYYEKIDENPIGGILPFILGNPNLKIESISNQIILKVKSLT